MAMVNTVLGPVAASDLGFTLSHEHVLLSAAGVNQTYPGFIDPDTDRHESSGSSV